jgi:integrase
MDREHGNWVDMEERTVGIGTLRKDIRGIKYLLKRAFDKRMIANYPHFARLRKNMNNVVDLPDQQKRARLTEEQALTIKSWRQSFRNKWKNVIEAERNDRDISVPHPFHHPKWRYNAVMFYVGISLTLTTGIRPMEIRLIRWKDIGDIFVDGDKKYSIIKIRREVSKVGKFRDTIANDFDRTAIRLQDWKYEWSKRFNREPTKEDYVFPTYMDSTKPKNHWFHIIRNHMKRIDVWAKSDGRDYEIVSHNNDNDLKVKKWISLYTFRSRHITLMIRANVSPYLLSRNIGSSTDMIDRYYNVNTNIEHREEFTKHLNMLMERDS